MNKNYVVRKHNNGDYNEANNWFNKCKELHIPYIIVTTRLKYADVEFDHYTMPKGYDKLLVIENENITKQNLEMLKKYGTKKSVIESSTFIIRFRNIPIENAEQLASNLYKIINKIVN